MKKAIIFDYDQVIVNSYIDHLAAFSWVAKKFGIKLNPKILYKKFGRSAKNILEELVPEMSEMQIKKFVEEKDKFYHKIAIKRGIHLMRGVREILQFLNDKKIKCAIASSASRSNLLLGLQKTKIRKYFSAIVAAEDVKHHKPHPEPLLKAAKLLKVKPKDCIYIGDSIYEMIAARRAKIFAVGITTGIYSKKQLYAKGADEVVENILELKKFLK